MATQQYDNVDVVYCDVMRDEHPDNQRFFNDVQGWIGQDIIRLKNDQFKSVEEVWDARQYMSGIAGAPCTVEMKKLPREEYQRPDDIHLFGYTVGEERRIERFEDNYPELATEWLLIENDFNKQACLDFLKVHGIALPIMYQLGYKNNNCIGCVKATSNKYWNMIKRDFPEVFANRAEQSRRIGAKLTRNGGQTRVFLDELEDRHDIIDELEDLSCGPICDISERNE